MDFSRPAPIIQVLLLVLVIPSAFTDFRERRVFNWVAFPGVVAALSINVYLHAASGLRTSLEGLGLALLIYLPLYLIRAMGAGDVKLMAAIGAASGPANWMLIFILTSLAGGVAAVFVILARGRLRPTLHNVGAIVISLLHLRAPYRDTPQLDVKSDRAVRLPHAVVIACGTLGFLVFAALGLPK